MQTGGRQVVELGPGPGALTRVLYRMYPEMLAVEIDPRAVELLSTAMPKLTVVQSDVLQVKTHHVYTSLISAAS